MRVLPRFVVLALVTACFADVSPSADTCGDASCEEHVSAELLQMNAADTAVQLLQRRASESLDATADTVEDNEDESDEESDAQSEDDGASTCKKKCQKQFTKWVKKGKEGAGVKRICAKSFCKDCSFCQQECKKKCSKKYNKFVKKGKWANNFKKVCGKDICKGCSFCEEEPPTPTPTAPCRDSCQSTYDKFVKKGKEGLGHQKVCEKSSCSGCSFCEEEFPTPAPTAPCQDSCQNTYDKFVKKGKEGLGHKKVCAKSSCSGCSFCEEEFPTPAPTGPCQDKCQDVYDKFAKKGKASEGKEAVCAKYSCSGCEMCTDDDWVPPTAEPTAEPTESPTEQPTAEPTLEPTAEPTEEPTGKTPTMQKQAEDAGQKPTMHKQVENAGKKPTMQKQAEDAAQIDSYPMLSKYPACHADMKKNYRLVLVAASQPYHGSTALQGVLMSSDRLATLCNYKSWQCEGNQIMEDNGFSKNHDQWNSHTMLRLYAQNWDISKPVLFDKSPDMNYPLFQLASDLSHTRIPNIMQHNGVTNLKFAYILMWRPICLASLSSHGKTRIKEVGKEALARSELKNIKNMVYSHRSMERHSMHVLVVNFADMIWKPDHTTKRINDFLPCLGKLDADYVPTLGKDVYPENEWKADGSIRQFGASIDPSRFYSVEKGTCLTDDFFLSLSHAESREAKDAVNYLLQFSA